MPHIDIFNGDADGLCALVQLRNAEPRDARVVTGVKRDIALVAKAGIGAGDVVTVLDVSFDKNRDGVEAALAAGAEVFYVDHHFAGDVPEHAALTTIIDPSPDTCTSLLVNLHLDGAFAAWAVVGAFGDNLDDSARGLAERIGLDAAQRDVARRLGTVLNYNGYGAALEDLHFAPADLFEQLRGFASPFEFVATKGDVFAKLEDGFATDMGNARAVEPKVVADHAALYVLPNAAWARRASGVFSNELANASPARAHAVLTERADGTFVVSVRAPKSNKTGADELCRRYPTGGGRAAAAGINALPADAVDGFAADFSAFFDR